MSGDREQARKLFERAYQCQQRGDLEGAARLYQVSIAEIPTAERRHLMSAIRALQARAN